MNRFALRLLICGVILASLAGAGPALAQDDSAQRKQAAEAFKKAEALYAEGNFRASITHFARAHELMPHATTLFSIARCHENLGQAAQALVFYRKALQASPPAALRADVEQRLRRLLAHPVKIFVSSKPSGASVTVDGREAAEAKVTPTVVALSPGEHVLLLRLVGHQLTARRVVVETGKEHAVEVALVKVARPTPPTKCPDPVTCPDLRLLDRYPSGFLFSANAIMGFGTGRPFTLGAGLHAMGLYRRLLFGLRFWGQSMVIHEIPQVQVSDTTVSPTTETTYARSSVDWYMVQAVGGYMIPFRSFYLYGDGGVGLSYERTTFQGNQTYSSGSKLETRSVKDSFSHVAFVWSVGGGIEAMAARWVSVGFNVQLGLLHGSRPDLYKPDSTHEDTAFMFATLAVAATFHL